VTVAGLCDLDGGAAANLGEAFGVSHTYTEVETMLDAEKPDVVHVLTPPQSHVEMVRAAATRGCHVLVEKPMAMDAAEARRMLACAEENGVRLCVDHNHLYDPAMVKARRLVESGAVGDVIWVESYYGFNLGNNPGARYMIPGARDHWTFALPGGLYQNLAPHPLSVALDVIGSPRSVAAEALPTRVVQHQRTDELRMVLRDDSRGGLVTVSLAASPRFQYLKIYGTRMTVLVDFLNKWVVTHRVLRGVPKPVSRAMMNLGESWAILRGTLSGMLKVLLRRWTPYEGMDLLIREFYASLEEGREPPVTAEEGLAVMEAMDRTWDLIGRQDAGAAVPPEEHLARADRK
jgi:predicted dehydrogenase